MIVPQVHALRPDDHLRVMPEVAVGRERHPVLVQRELARRAFARAARVRSCRRGSSRSPVAVKWARAAPPAILGFYASRDARAQRGPMAAPSFPAGHAHGSTMHIGVPKEIKVLEHRVGLTPESVREICTHGHQVVVETGAGQGIGMDDEAYRRAGATIVTNARGGLRAGGNDRQGEGAASGRAQDVAGRPGALYVFAPCARSRPGPRLDRERRRMHRVRNGDVPDRRTATARADVRSRGTNGYSGRRAFPRKSARWPRCLARWRARCGSRPRSSSSVVASWARMPVTSPSAWARKCGCSIAIPTCCARCGGSSGGR